MGINLDKMREKLSSLRGDGNSSNDTFWRLLTGTRLFESFRLRTETPSRRCGFTTMSRRAVSCAPSATTSDECPVCEFASQLWREGVDNNDEHSKKTAKSLFVRQRFFSPVMVRGEEEKGMRVWGYGKTAYENLLTLVLNPEYGDITDTETGTDLSDDLWKASGRILPSDEACAASSVLAAL